jgi:methanogenic corrinoid protein MtbC1
MDDKLALALADLEEETALNMVDSKLAAGEDATAIMDACRTGMVEVGKRYEAGEYFISDLMMAGEILKQVTGKITPYLKGDTTEPKGKVVAGTVKGDIHDIGKDIVVAMLKSNNFDVTDLGVDVPPDKFVQALKDTGASVLSLSGLLTVAFDGMKETVQAVEAAGLRDKVKVMVGGGPVTDKVREYTGADAWGADAQAAVTLANQWVEVAR